MGALDGIGSFIYESFINLCLIIDGMLISINGALFGTFMEIAKHEVDRSIFGDITKKIYIIIGIFMIFRVAFSLIQMLANPDMLADKEKGAGKLATRVVIVFALIVMVPTIFEMAYGLQNAVLDDNIIGSIFNAGGVGEKDYVENKGSEMAMDIFKGMIKPVGSKRTNCMCAVTTDNGCGTTAYNKATSISEIRSAEKNGLHTNPGTLDCFTDKSVDDGYLLEYRPLISSVALGMMAWLMVGYCIDIGVRYLKLVFLQLIAPICIATYVVGGKDNSFNKWIKMTTSTYLLVFMRLMIIYIIMFIAKNITSITDKLSSLSSVAVILGMLVFAKNAPKLISDLFGIQEDKEGGLKGIAKAALLGAAAMGVGGVGSAVSKFAASKQAGNGFLKSLGAGVTGLGSGAVAGAFSGAKAKNPFEAFKGGVGIAQKKGQQTLNNGTTSWFNRTGARIQSGLGLQTAADRYDSQIEGYNAIKDSAKNLQDYAAGEVAKDNSTMTTFTWTDENGNQITSRGNVNTLKEYANQLRMNGGNARDIAMAESRAKIAEKQAIADYITNNATSDSTVAAGISEINALNNQYGLDMATVTNGASVQDAKTGAIDAVNDIKTREDYIRSQEIKRTTKQS